MRKLRANSYTSLTGGTSNPTTTEKDTETLHDLRKGVHTTRKNLVHFGHKLDF